MWGKVAQGLVRTHCVIGKLPKAELLVQGCDLQGKVFDLIELLGMGTLCPFHRTIELGRARWQYEEAKASLLTRLLKARSIELDMVMDCIPFLDTPHSRDKMEVPSTCRGVSTVSGVWQAAAGTLLGRDGSRRDQI